MIINEFSNLADSRNNIKRYEPICLAEETKKNEFRLFNLNASSLTSNETNITTNVNVYIFDADKKSFKYQGNTYILNCEMSSIDVNYATQVMQWYNNDTTIRVIDGKEYILSDSSHVIRFFKISRPNARADTPLEPDSNDVNWKSHEEGHTPQWLSWLLIGIIPATIFLHHLIRYGNTRRAGRSILSDLIRNVRKFNENDNIDEAIVESLGKTLDAETFKFTPKSILYRNKEDLEEVKNAYKAFLENENLEVFLKPFITDDKEKKRDPAELIDKLDSGLVEEFRSLFRSNIQVLEEAMYGAYYNFTISQKILKLRNHGISEKSINNILDRFTYGTTDVASWGKKTLDMLDALKPISSITIDNTQDLDEELEEGEQNLKTVMQQDVQQLEGDIQKTVKTVQQNLEREDEEGKKEGLESQLYNRNVVSDVRGELNTSSKEEKQQFFTNLYNRFVSFFTEDVSGKVEEEIEQALLSGTGDI